MTISRQEAEVLRTLKSMVILSKSHEEDCIFVCGEMTALKAGEEGHLPAIAQRAGTAFRPTRLEGVARSRSLLKDEPFYPGWDSFKGISVSAGGLIGAL